MFKSKNKNKMNTPVNPSFYYIKVGCKGVFITQNCWHDDKKSVYMYIMTFEPRFFTVLH